MSRHPQVANAVRYLLDRRDLAPVLPGVYAPADATDALVTRLAALRQWDPAAVVTGTVAARLTFWKEAPVGAVECAVGHRRVGRPGFKFTRRTIPPELIIERAGLRMTSPGLTALDLCDTVGGDAIDYALRSRMTTVRHLQQAMDLTANRVGNPQRRQLLLDSRSEPWSAAERKFHRMLRDVRIGGWHANRPLVLEGQAYFPDVRFDRERLVVEIDGREHHIGVEVFETDRWRQNLLVLADWTVLRFTWRMLDERSDEVVAMVRAALTRRGGRAFLRNLPPEGRSAR